MAVNEWEICRSVIGHHEIRVVLCDDDSSCRQSLERELRRIFEKLHISAQIASFASLAQMPESVFKSCAMVFLDIDFEDEEYTGIDIARFLRRVNERALIFFVTNFIEYAPAGYEVQAFRYVLKRDMDEVLERYVMQGIELLAEGQEYLRLRDREETVELALDEITYLGVLDHSVSIYAQGKEYTVNTTLTALAQQLEQHGFLRIHKSYLVNMRFIRKLRSRGCLLADGTNLAVGEKHYAQQKQKYLLWKGLV